MENFRLRDLSLSGGWPRAARRRLWRRHSASGWSGNPLCTRCSFVFGFFWFFGSEEFSFWCARLFILFGKDCSVVLFEWFWQARGFLKQTDVGSSPMMVHFWKQNSVVVHRVIDIELRICRHSWLRLSFYKISLNPNPNSLALNESINQFITGPENYQLKGHGILMILLVDFLWRT